MASKMKLSMASLACLAKLDPPWLASLACLAKPDPPSLGKTSKTFMFIGFTGFTGCQCSKTFILLGFTGFTGFEETMVLGKPGAHHSFPKTSKTSKTK